jgi:hypothetical protein
MTLKAPFPYFGGKSKIAAEIWKRLGEPANFVEPFFGSGAVLLGRPDWQPDKSLIETVNDKSGYVSNFWRAVAADPECVAYYADWPVDECSLHARHMWLLQRKDELAARLEGDPDWHDPKIAGWWAWGMSCWIGSGFCSGQGPWGWAEDENGDRKLVHLGDAGRGVTRKLVHLGDAGRGVTRKLVHLGDAGMGVNRQLVHLGDAGMGVNRQRVHLGNAGMGDLDSLAVDGLTGWMVALSERLRRVRVCCGNWTRVMGPTVTEKNGLTGIFLDPPYSAEAGRNEDLYEQEDLSVAHDVRRWCLENGNNPMLRIALAGYDSEGHDELERHGWTALAWKAHGGYGSQGNGSGRANAHREVIWFSPFCLAEEKRLSLFDLMNTTDAPLFAGMG